MFRTWAILLFSAAVAGPVAADICCPDQSYVTASFATAKDRVTIVPGGGGETFASAGITIDVYIRHCDGRPCAGVPAENIQLYNSALCYCPGNTADGPTDAEGHTTFSGTLSAGGCVENLSLYVEGIFIGTIPVKTNSDAGDLSYLADKLRSLCP